MVRFGIEEEFMVLNRRTLAPVPQGAAARAALTSQSALTSRDESPGGASSEFLDCQVEIATSPSLTLVEAGEELEKYRRLLGGFSRRADVLVASSGTPYGYTDTLSVTAAQRYRAIADLMGGLAREHLVNGMHVHTEVVDIEDRVHALNAVRPWLPILLACTTNSPFWRKRTSGFASWRSILLRRLPTMWCPPVFRDADEYQRRVDRLVELGAVIDRASIAWAVRVSDSYDTVEVRVFDGQLTIRDTLLAAALTRAIVSERPQTLTMDSETIDASLWMAARDGMRARLIDPRTGDVAPASGVLRALIESAQGALSEYDDLDFVEHRIGRLHEFGTGADRQHDALSQGGVEGLARLLVPAGGDDQTADPSGER